MEYVHKKTPRGTAPAEELQNNKKKGLESRKNIAYNPSKTIFFLVEENRICRQI